VKQNQRGGMVTSANGRPQATNDKNDKIEEEEKYRERGG